MGFMDRLLGRTPTAVPPEAPRPQAPTILPSAEEPAAPPDAQRTEGIVEMRKDTRNWWYRTKIRLGGEQVAPRRCPVCNTRLLDGTNVCPKGH